MNHARTVFEQTGWRRPYPQMLCMRYETLCKITEYGYDLSDASFVDYARRRGCLNAAFKEESALHEYVREYRRTLEEFLADNRIDITHAQLYKGKRHKYTREEILGSWKIVLVARANLQDCWEVWHMSAAECRPVPPAMQLGQTTLF